VAAPGLILRAANAADAGTMAATMVEGFESYRAFAPAARERGHAGGRLRTPAGQARARRFYERHGWRLEGPPAQDDEIGFAVAVYRRTGLD
jgi:hypothetical protein